MRSQSISSSTSSGDCTWLPKQSCVRMRTVSPDFTVSAGSASRENANSTRSSLSSCIGTSFLQNLAEAHSTTGKRSAGAALGLPLALFERCKERADTRTQYVDAACLRQTAIEASLRPPRPRIRASERCPRPRVRPRTCARASERHLRPRSLHPPAPGPHPLHRSRVCTRTPTLPAPSLRASRMLRRLFFGALLVARRSRHQNADKQHNDDGNDGSCEIAHGRHPGHAVRRHPSCRADARRQHRCGADRAEHRERARTPPPPHPRMRTPPRASWPPRTKTPAARASSRGRLARQRRRTQPRRARARPTPRATPCRTLPKSRQTTRENAAVANARAGGRHKPRRKRCELAAAQRAAQRHRQSGVRLGIALPSDEIPPSSRGRHQHAAHSRRLLHDERHAQRAVRQQRAQVRPERARKSNQAPTAPRTAGCPIRLPAECSPTPRTRRTPSPTRRTPAQRPVDAMA